ncbi:MAG: PBP1A family penicillin-binding protein [Alphaproteobacteria bacterium]|nr:PBP1A family penicillin-binding protein [Alphaproteobacteria bacterium]
MRSCAVFLLANELLTLKNLPTRNAFFRAIWTADARVSTALFEFWDFLKRAGSAYSSFLYRYFRLSGLKRVFIDLLDDFVTFGVVAAFGLLAFALPPFSGTGDIWNRGREYSVTFTDNAGKIIGRRGIRQDDAIPLDEIPPILIKAVLATEDARFYDHFGVDVIGTLRALVHNAKGGGSKQGGSSITQQVAKNLFLSPERTMRRKVNEAFLSLWIEARLSKDEILKLYLDRSYLGGGSYGVEAASQFYFGKSVRDIELPEAAVLAGLFKAPTSYAPHTNPEASRIRTQTVLYRMLDAGFISQGELLQAKRDPAQIVQQNQLASPNWFLDWAYQDTLDVMQRQGLMSNYVVEVKTTIDSRLQDASQNIINDVVDNLGPDRNFGQASSLTMSPDGAVRAIIGGRDYGDSQFNRATAAKRQVGSAFKPFVYLTALENGYTRDSIVVDGPVCVVNWCVRNFEPGFRGRIPLWQALTHSINTIAVKLMVEFGRKNVEATARRMGIQGYIDPYPTMAIGTSALTLMDLTTGYATIASGGKLARPYAVVEIRKPNGDLLYSHGTNAVEAPQVSPPDKIADLISMMHDVVMQGTATRAQLGYEPVAGKTGTNANFRDAWFMGFTGHFVTGVWVGNDDNTPMDGSKVNAVTGGRVPAPAWKRIMDVAESGLQPIGLPGAPLDKTYSGSAPAFTADAVVPATPANEASPLTVDPALPEVTDAGGLSADAKNVLDGMFNLFDSSAPPSDSVVPVATSSQAAAKSKSTNAPKGLVLPKPNVTNKKPRTIFDLLFPSSTGKEKKKGIFGF